MSAFTAFPADGMSAQWTLGEESEHPGTCDQVDIVWENEAWTISHRSEGADVQVIVRVGPDWTTRQCILFRDLDEPDLWLGTDGAGMWGEINGTHRTDLDGALDVCLPASAITPTLALRRLDLDVGETGTSQRITLDVETLGVTVHRCDYTRVGDTRYQMTTGPLTFEFSVDTYGFVTADYPGFIRN